MISEVSKLIKHYQLSPHFEGGYFRETYRSTGNYIIDSLEKSYSTAILYLLSNGQKSRLHRIKSDEMWHYYSGDAPVNLVTIENNDLKITKLGHDIDKNQVAQIVVPAGIWFGAYVDDGYALTGCTVSPGFDVKDYQVPTLDEILKILDHPSDNDLRLLKYLMVPPDGNLE